MEIKQCTKCKKELPLECFYKRTGNGNLRSACKECTNKIARRSYPLFREKRNEAMRGHYKENKRQYQISHAKYRRSERGKEISRDAQRRFLKTKKGKESSGKSQKKWGKRNLEKRRAHWAVKAALKAGKMKRERCSICGVKAEAHHEDYNKPFNIIWLCVDHHKERHRIVII